MAWSWYRESETLLCVSLDHIHTVGWCRTQIKALLFRLKDLIWRFFTMAWKSHLERGHQLDVIRKKHV